MTQGYPALRNVKLIRIFPSRGMNRVLERGDSVVAEPGWSAPDHDVAMVQADALGVVAAPNASE